MIDFKKHGKKQKHVDSETEFLCQFYSFWKILILIFPYFSFQYSYNQLFRSLLIMSDTTDHATSSTPYRHEITISVGGDSEDRIQIKTPQSVSTPTPSPRSLQSTTDEISTNSTDDDSAILAPKQTSDPIGVDNLAFENDQKTSQQRPLSSFGQNENNANAENTNGKNSIDKPLTGKYYNNNNDMINHSKSEK